ncbi:MAG TPA: glycoside hydrolase family 88 protein [Prolixibacteraceae bacterium]|nr:glycoside hydrolase family 88 protein [Prolixibacteraceae bacterium]HPR59831.1 glycoside hydrolase family 88 protein [Prolixibacteraceae bacterium]
MKYFFIVALSLLMGSCVSEKNNETLLLVENSLEIAKQQSLLMAKHLVETDDRLPKTIGADGKLETSNAHWWTSGFFPGQLWYMYEYTQNDEFRNYAEQFSQKVASQQYTTDNHDIGFIIFCSYGNAYRITGNSDYLPIIENAAISLSSRYNERTKTIRSWDRASWNQQWQYAVIIDNMMNLELLEWAAQKFEKPRFSEIARSHANTTITNHFRPDGSSFHVVSYDTLSGVPELFHTAQGYSHSSAWARGQAWGLYGFTMMYRFSGNQQYLDQAIKIADFIVNHPRLPDDKIPYWDFDAPDIPHALRDVSAGAIICSTLLELHQYVDTDKAKQYFGVAEKQIISLCNEPYLAKPATNANFILKHSVGHMPNGTEVDVPLSYADYYFVEALMRYRKQFN